MPNHIILATAGPKGCGKNTFCRGAVTQGQHLGRTCTTLAFADALRDITAALFGNRYETEAAKNQAEPFWADKLGEPYSTGRRILQTLGTDVFRNHVHPDIWCLVMEHRLRYAMEHCDLITVTDVRFENEAALIRRLGGVVVHLTREGLHTSDTHVSEAGIAQAPEDWHFSSDSPLRTETQGASAVVLLSARGLTEEDLSACGVPQ